MDINRERRYFEIVARALQDINGMRKWVRKGLTGDQERWLRLE